MSASKKQQIEKDKILFAAARATIKQSEKIIFFGRSSVGNSSKAERKTSAAVGPSAIPLSAPAASLAALSPVAASAWLHALTHLLLFEETIQL